MNWPKRAVVDEVLRDGRLWTLLECGHEMRGSVFDDDGVQTETHMRCYHCEPSRG